MAMVDIVERIARKKWEITAQNGDHFETVPGKQYTTMLRPWDDGTVTVFSRFWVRVPFDVFADPAYSSVGERDE
jgi:hypothetical protein